MTSIQAHRKLWRAKQRAYAPSLPASYPLSDEYQAGWKDCQSSVVAYLRREEEWAPSVIAMAAMFFRIDIEIAKPGSQVQKASHRKAPTPPIANKGE